jgi:hypothetical protein
MQMKLFPPAVAVGAAETLFQAGKTLREIQQEEQENGGRPHKSKENSILA